MSSPVGHVLGAAIAYAAAAKVTNLPRLAKRHYLGLAVLALLPDTDAALLSIIPHRGITHGILGTLTLSFLFYFLFKNADTSDVGRSKLAVVSVFCAATHPIMDTLACPVYPVRLFAPFRHSDFSIDPHWTLLPQPYYQIVNETLFLPWSAIVDNIPQIIFELLILGSILVFLRLLHKGVPNRFILYSPLVVSCLSWVCWRLYFPTIWMR